MDLKFRLDSIHRQQQNKQHMQRKTEPNFSDPKNIYYADLKRYQRPNRNTTVNETIQKPVQRSTLSKYYKTAAAPKNQWKHYMGNTNNVFYQQREDAQALVVIRNIKNVLLIILLFLGLLYFMMRSITKFQGQCPVNADCLVYVHCHAGLVYDQQNNKCVIDPSLINKAEDICLLAINQLKMQYGDNQCSSEQAKQNYMLPPSKRIEELYNSQTLEGDQQNIERLKDQILSFLMNKENQQNYNFTVVNSKIVPLEKLYSFGCRINLHIKSRTFILELLITIVVSIAGFTIYQMINRRNKASTIYSQLKQRLLSEKTINVSNSLEQLQLKYGKIDQKTWQLVDQLRTIEQRIGYYQQNFLYWRLL